METSTGTSVLDVFLRILVFALIGILILIPVGIVLDLLGVL